MRRTAHSSLEEEMSATHAVQGRIKQSSRYRRGSRSRRGCALGREITGRGIRAVHTGTTAFQDGGTEDMVYVVGTCILEDLLVLSQAIAIEANEEASQALKRLLEQCEAENSRRPKS